MSSDIFKMSRTFGFWCLILSVIMITGSVAHTVNDVRKLIEDKTQGYNRKLRPVYDQTKTMYVGAQFELVAIQEFDEVAEKFTVVGIFSLGWFDELIAWNPLYYGNMTQFAAEGGDFWSPTLVLINAHGEVPLVGNGWNMYRYLYDGTVIVAPGDVFDTTCTVDATNYPWDEQQCNLNFMAWGYTEEEVKLVANMETVGTTYYNRNGAWDIIKTSAEGVDGSIDFKIWLRRKPQFVLINVILPVVLMSFLNIVVFLIPTESGERISYCLTVLLATAVFLTLVGDNLPKTSSPMSLLSYYLTSMLALSVCIVFTTILSLRIYFRDEKKLVPRCLSVLVRCLCCKLKRRPGLKYEYPSRFEHVSSDERLPRYRTDNDDDVIMVDRVHVAHRYYDNWDHNNGVDRHGHVTPQQGGYVEKRPRATNKDVEKVTWKDVSFAVDIVFFVIFFCCLISATVVFFVTAMN